MVAELKQAKRLPSLLDIVARCGKNVEMPQVKIASQAKAATDKTKIEETFAQTMQIVLKKKPTRGIDVYAVWLIRHTHGLEKCKSAVSGEDIFLAGYGNYSDLPKNRLLTLVEAKALGAQAKLEESEIQDIGFKNVQNKIGKIAFFNTDIQDGQYINDIECTISIDAVNCYRTVCAVYSKYCAYSFWPRSSQHIFGCDTVFDSSFCINCYHSVNLQRCFEMDGCSSSSDCLFCHNVENLQDCMFCFNTKNKRYAIGNVEIGRDNYLKIKEKVLEQINNQLEKSAKLDVDVFSL
jgi:hypothetical protein